MESQRSCGVEKPDLDWLGDWIKQNPFESINVIFLVDTLRISISPYLNKTKNDTELCLSVNYLKLDSRKLLDLKSKIGNVLDLILVKIHNHRAHSVTSTDYSVCHLVDEIIKTGFVVGEKPMVNFKNLKKEVSNIEIIYILIYMYRLYEMLEKDLEQIITQYKPNQKIVKSQIDEFCNRVKNNLFYKMNFGYKVQNFINDIYGLKDAESDEIMARVGNLLKIRSVNSLNRNLNRPLELNFDTLFYLGSAIFTLWTAMLFLHELQDNRPLVSLLFLIMLSIYVTIDHEFISPANRRKKFLVVALSYIETKDRLLPNFTESLRKINSDKCLDLFHNSSSINLLKPK